MFFIYKHKKPKYDGKDIMADIRNNLSRIKAGGILGEAGEMAKVLLQEEF